MSRRDMPGHKSEKKYHRHRLEIHSHAAWPLIISITIVSRLLCVFKGGAEAGRGCRGCRKNKAPPSSVIRHSSFCLQRATDVGVCIDNRKYVDETVLSSGEVSGGFGGSGYIHTILASSAPPYLSLLLWVYLSIALPEMLLSGRRLMKRGTGIWPSWRCKRTLITMNEIALPPPPPPAPWVATVRFNNIISKVFIAVHQEMIGLFSHDLLTENLFVTKQKVLHYVCNSTWSEKTKWFFKFCKGMCMQCVYEPVVLMRGFDSSALNVV